MINFPKEDSKTVAACNHLIRENLRVKQNFKKVRKYFNFFWNKRGSSLFLLFHHLSCAISNVHGWYSTNIKALFTITVLSKISTLLVSLGSLISNGREPKNCLGRVFKSKLDRITILCSKCVAWHAATSRVENSVQGLSCQLKFVHG
jgi:hypothetical protein